ncbi:type II secretion system GspH family protein [Verrucomicrobiales bacterium]|jgi:prepilin-type N-terminal cleavage/methylation domain-containing protein|nr:type II secretion system GspH family protein [Verrucomicrobiales bacterium]MDC0276174.1 type II secretion system GspH family protein [Verrucomicrobiales bacterium]
MNLVRATQSNKTRGMTLLEILVVFAVVAILAGVVISISDSFRKRAETAQCLSKMRTVHSGLSSYLIDQGHWPQLPPEAMEFSETEYFTFWMKSIEPYGISEENWLCPSDKINKEKFKKEKTGSYIPTAFDGFMITPHRWNQPWLVERGDLHGKGAHIAMPDGSINPSTKAFGGR